MQAPFLRFATGIALGVACITGGAGMAHGQEKPDHAEEAGETQTITIEGKRPLNRIDRQVYDVDQDEKSGNESAADALAKVPGVDVTPSGDVTLRGDPVQILINGKPSPLFSGDNRAAALKAMPSGMIASIEVMTNPGAQYGSGASGGLINIVTRRAIMPGAFGNVSGRGMSNGGYSLSNFGQYARQRLSVTYMASLAETPSDSRNSLTSSELDGNGRTVHSIHNTGESAMRNRMTMANATLDYDLSEKDRISGQFNYMDSQNTSRGTSRMAAYDGTGATVTRFDSLNHSILHGSTGLAGVSWTRLGRRLGEQLTVDARVSRQTTGTDLSSLMAYQVSSLPENRNDRMQSNRIESATTTHTLSIDYTTSLAGDQIAAGLQITQDDAQDDNLAFAAYSPGTELPVLNPLLSSQAGYRQRISALYATYQKALGEHWVVLAGLRPEALDYTGRDEGTGAPVHVAYGNINPSLFATYVLSPAARLRFNYSRRLQRPAPRDLNPALTIVNNQTVKAGTPALRPQTTDSFEAAYEKTRNFNTYSARLYHLRDERLITPVTVLVEDPQNTGVQVLRVSPRNAGSSTRTGAQLNFSGSRGKLFLNATLNVSETHMRVPDVLRPRSLMTAAGQLNLSYRLNDKADIALNYNAQGRQLIAEGYSLGYATGSVTYNRMLTPATTLSLGVTDILHAGKPGNTRDTRYVRSAYFGTQPGATVFIGLSRRYGAMAAGRLE